MEQRLSPMTIHISRTSFVLAVAVAGFAIAGCGRQSRGNADAYDQSRAAKPSEGGATSTSGSAGESKNFGDTRTKTEVDGRSPSASPTGLSQDTKAEHNVSTPAAGASTGQQSQQAQPKQEQPK
jgi:hypothetical protein